nr:hypothetical protein CFP56_09673 [Quercus suber]
MGAQEWRKVFRLRGPAVVGRRRGKEDGRLVMWRKRNGGFRGPGLNESSGKFQFVRMPRARTVGGVQVDLSRCAGGRERKRATSLFFDWTWSGTVAREDEEEGVVCWSLS